MKTPWTKSALEMQFPWITWTTPVQMRKTGDHRVYHACRICIANLGIKGTDIKTPVEIGHLFGNQEDCVAHIQREHPE